MCWRPTSLLVVLLLGQLRTSGAEERLDDFNTSEIHISATRLSPSPLPAPAFDTLVETLSFHPTLDLQSRNRPGAQGDLAIRGGTFENSGLRVGGAALFDAQTGHYLLEQPLPPRMLGPLEVVTGLDLALSGLNAATGILSYGWAPIADGIAGAAGLGTEKSRELSLYVGRRGLGHIADQQVHADIELSHSESDGTVSFGDHHFQRVAGRLQLEGVDSQTDLFAGWQSKDFSWPYLYALRELHTAVQSSGIEQEKLQGSLFWLNHRRRFNAESWLEAAAFYRRHDDDYEFDRFDPGRFNPFCHRLESAAVALSGGRHFGRLGLRYNLQVLEDQLKSSALTYGSFMSRNYRQGALLAERALWSPAAYELRLSGGVSYFDSNRNRDSLAPLGRLELSRNQATPHSYYLEYSGVAQAPSYTALNSNPDSGLFRGNPNLAVQRSRNLAAGLRRGAPERESGLNVFYRKDQDLTDWTFRSELSPLAARSAQNLDLAVWGLELSQTWAFSQIQLRGAYSWLHKDPDYNDSDNQDAAVDASFYALNYPRHRWLLELSAPLHEALLLQVRNEYRRQYPNVLRGGRENVFFTDLSATLTDPRWRSSSLQLSISNLWNTHFEAVPGVPGTGRLITAYLRWYW